MIGTRRAEVPATREIPFLGFRHSPCEQAEDYAKCVGLVRRFKIKFRFLIFNGYEDVDIVSERRTNEPTFLREFV